MAKARLKNVVLEPLLISDKKLLIYSAASIAANRLL
jgi:hypothetical protein